LFESYFNQFLLNYVTNLKEEVCISVPEGVQVAEGRKCLRLNKALYGLKQSPREWHQNINGFLLSLGFKRLQAFFFFFGKIIIKSYKKRNCRHHTVRKCKCSSERPCDSPTLCCEASSLSQSRSGEGGGCGVLLSVILAQPWVPGETRGPCRAMRSRRLLRGGGGRRKVGEALICVGARVGRVRRAGAGVR